MSKKYLSIYSLVVFSLFGLFLSFPKQTLAVVSSTPDPDTYITDGTVYSTVVASDGTTYLGGNFSRVGAYTGNGVPIDATTGSSLSTFPKVDSTVNVSISDGSGGWYIGGEFYKVGDYNRTSLAHIKSDGTVDQAFNLNTDEDGSVSSLALSGTTLYVGGSFTTVNGVTHNNLAAINTTDSTVIDTFNPSTNGNVNSLALSGTTLYVGGNFTAVNGATHNYLAAINTIDGTVIDTFDLNLNNYVRSLALSGTTLYVGGEFTAVVNEASHNYLVAINTTDGTLIDTFNLNLNNSVSSLALSVTTLYVGGEFTFVNEASHNRLVAINTTDSTVINTFNPSIEYAEGGDSAYVFSLALSGTTLYVGGYFVIFNEATHEVTHNNLAAINTTDGTVIDTFNPSTNGNGGSVHSLALSGTTLYVGGEFTMLNNSVVFSPNLVQIKPDGKISPFLIFNEYRNMPVFSLLLSADNTILYIGGVFPGYLLAVNTTTGMVIDTFTPSVGGRTFVTSMALSPSGDILYVGGDFSAAGGVSLGNIAAFKTADANTIVSTFKPIANGVVYSMALSPSGDILYVGGDFTTVNGVARNHLAAINTTNGAVIDTFNPSINSSVSSLALSGTTLYVGGYFTTVNGASHNNLAAINTTNGAVIDTFNLNIEEGIGVSSLALSGTTLYVGGSFTTVNGVTHNNLAAINTTDSTVIDTFNPSINSPVQSLALSGTTLYVGGYFLAVGDDYSKVFFATFSDDESSVILNTAKSSAKEDVAIALATYSEENYTTENWITLNAFHTDGDIAIDAALTVEDVNTAKTTAINGMAGVATIPTDENTTTPDESGAAILGGSATKVVITDADQPVTVTIENGTTNPTVDISSFTPNGDGERIIPAITVTSSIANIIIDSGTKITAPGWNGIMKAPTKSLDSSGSAPSGFRIGNTIIELGSSDESLLFDKAVKITIPGITGKVGYKKPETNNWYMINTKCNSATDHSNISSPNECYYPSGSDTIIWTYHFTEFGGLDKVSHTSGSIPRPIVVVPVTTTTNTFEGCDNRITGFSTTTGQSCIGNTITTTYDFGTTTLKNGSKGEAVKELQRYLNEKLNLGLIIDGMLGPKTIIVIKQWQKEHGLVADGLVGKMTKTLMKQY